MIRKEAHVLQGSFEEAAFGKGVVVNDSDWDCYLVLDFGVGILEGVGAGVGVEECSAPPSGLLCGCDCLIFFVVVIVIVIRDDTIDIIVFEMEIPLYFYSSARLEIDGLGNVNDECCILFLLLVLLGTGIDSNSNGIRLGSIFSCGTCASCRRGGGA